MKIIPALLEDNKQELILKIHELSKYFDHIHIDLITNHYKYLHDTITLNEISAAVEKFPNIKFDLHIMSSHYGECLVNNEFTQYFDKIFVHIENKIKIDIQKYSNIVYAFDLHTHIFDYKQIIESADEILLMSVPAGKQGQKFNIVTYEKIRKIVLLNPEIKIYLDGGIKMQIYEKLKNNKNIKSLIVGSHIDDFINKT